MEEQRPKNLIWNTAQLKKARVAVNLSGVAAAKMLGITPEYLSMLEHQSRRPSQELISKMAICYRRPISYFLAENIFAVAAKKIIG